MQDDKVTSKQNKIRIRQRNAGMTYRKWISVFLCVIFVCGLLAGCGNDKVQEEQNDNFSANKNCHRRMAVYNATIYSVQISDL